MAGEDEYTATSEQRQVDQLFRRMIYEDIDQGTISSYFETYADRFEWGEEEAIRNFFANAGWIVNSYLDAEREKDAVFKQISNALSNDIPMKQWFADMMSQEIGSLGEPVYHGVSEGELKEAYDRLEPYP
jgi:hypothetical protein